MNIEKLTMEQAKELFCSEESQQSWSMAIRLIGSPVECAFKDNYIMKLRICAAINEILVQKDEAAAKETLKSLKEGCTTDLDDAVCAMLSGLFAETFELNIYVVLHYEEAMRKCPGMYLAHYRRAKVAYDCKVYTAAARFCCQALSCLREDKMYGQEELKKIEVQLLELMDAAEEKWEELQKSLAPQPTKTVMRTVKPLEEIWGIEDKTDFRLELGDYIEEKCQSGKKCLH